MESQEFVQNIRGAAFRAVSHAIFLFPGGFYGGSSFFKKTAPSLFYETTLRVSLMFFVYFCRLHR